MTVSWLKPRQCQMHTVAGCPIKFLKKKLAEHYRRLKNQIANNK